MRTSHTYSLLVAFVVLSVGLFMQPALSQVIFDADFESESGDNAVDLWVPDNEGQAWDRTDTFPGSGFGLAQPNEGCGNSGNTLLPGVDNFTDGIIQLDMSWADDDSWGVVLRKTADDAGWLVVFGYIETPAILIANLADGCADTGNCLDQVGCENGGLELLQEDHGFDPTTLTMDLTVSYTGRIQVDGDIIRVWYLPTSEVPNPMGDLGTPTVEFQTDGSHDGPGSVGIWHESQGSSMIDNVLVTGPGLFTSVDPLGKLPTAWGILKATY